MPNPTFTSNLNLVLLATGARGWGDLVNATSDTLDGLTALGTLAVAPADIDPTTGASTSMRVKVSAGVFRKSDGTAVAFAGSAGTTLAASFLSYLYLDDAGNLQVNATGFPTGSNLVRLATVVTGASAVLRVTDQRVPFSSFGASALGASAAANLVYAGPSSGPAAVPSFRALAAADVPALDASVIASGVFAASRLPVFAGSGASHAPGAVPDPGAAGGSSRYLREDGSWTVPTTSSGGVAAVSLNAPTVLYSSPVNYAVSSGVATGSLVLVPQAAGLVFAGPALGPAATPTFRALSAVDVPNLATTYCSLTADQTIAGSKAFSQMITGSVSGTAATITGTIAEGQVANLLTDLSTKQTHSTTLDALASATYSSGVLLGGQGTGAPLPVTIGAGLALSGGTLSATPPTGGGGGSGTVTSVALTMPAGFSVSGSPVTASGTFAVATALSGVLKGTGSGFSPAVAGVDYLAPNGDGSALSNLNGAAIASGVIAAARLPLMGPSGVMHGPGAVPDPGSGGGNTRYLREDGAWVVPSSNTGPPPPMSATSAAFAPPETPPTVAGSIADGSALGSLLRALAGLRLIANETTA